MKLLHAAAALLTVGLVAAAPADLEVRAPSNHPINLKDGPKSSASLKCGKNTYTGKQVYLSAQYGVNLQQAGETRGKHSYPHEFNNDDSKGNKLVFPAGCPADKNRFEYPLKSPVYDGGKNNVKQGDERVVYYWKKGDKDYQGNPNVIYCGIMTHEGAPTGGFLLC